MNDKKKIEIKTNKKQINLNENDEVAYWTERFDITKVKLKAAINAVGNTAQDVEAYLKRR